MKIQSKKWIWNTVNCARQKNTSKKCHLKRCKSAETCPIHERIWSSRRHNIKTEESRKRKTRKKNSSVEKQKHHITFHRSCSVAFSGVLEWAHCGGVIENEPKQLKRIRQCVCVRHGGMMMMISGGSTAVLRCRCLYLHTIKREWGMVYIRWRWM